MNRERTPSHTDGEILITSIERARELAERLGLDPYPVQFWLVDHDELNQVIAYNGFQDRYPHWRWGMQYEKRRKSDRYGGGTAFEIVNNDNPAHAFLRDANTLTDQKAVVTHVLAHADFFKHNEWFRTIEPDEPGPSAMLSRHARRIESIMAEPGRDREAVERWIDHVLCIRDTIDQHREFTYGRRVGDGDGVDQKEPSGADPAVANLGVRDEVREAIFEEGWREEALETAAEVKQGEPDVLAFLRSFGMQFDRETERAVEMEDWRREIIEMLRAEAHYFAPQRMTKIMNEGWAAYHESVMMADEGLAEPGEVLDYADHLSKVLGSPGLNPYALGKRLWEYIENRTNRQEVLKRVLGVQGVTWRTITEGGSLDRTLDVLEPPPALSRITVDSLPELRELDDRYVDGPALERAIDGELDVESTPWRVLTYEGLAWRNYSLLKPQHRGFLSRVGMSEVERIERYLDAPNRYETLEEAAKAVDVTAGWDRMREVRESHNDVTFLDEFLTPEFFAEREYFTIEYRQDAESFEVNSREPEAIKRKLLTMFTNFGKPRITVLDGNFENRNELLLGHHYTGIMLDIQDAKRTLERVFELWGRPVNLKTVVNPMADPELEGVSFGRSAGPDTKKGVRLRYDGEEFATTELAWSEVADIVETE